MINLRVIWSNGWMMGRSYRMVLFYALSMLFLLEEVIAKKKTHLELKKQSTAAALFYVGLAIMLVVIFMCCAWFCRQICPDGPSFSSLDLDEIRLERLDDIEQSMKKQIRELQSQLNVHQKKKAEIMYGNIQLPVNQHSQSERTGLLHDEEMGFEFDSPQKNAATPYRRKNEDMKTPTPVSVQNPMSTREEKEDEKDEDLWQLWNRMYSSTGKPKDKQEDDAKQSKEYAYKSIKFERKAPPPQRSPARNETPAITESTSPVVKKASDTPTSIPKSKPPPPQTPPPSTTKKMDAVKIGTGAMIDDDYKIDIGQTDHHYRPSQVKELKASPSFSGGNDIRSPPVHKFGNPKIDYESPSSKPTSTNVTRRPPPPRGPPPGFRKPRPPPPLTSSKKD